MRQISSIVSRWARALFGLPPFLRFGVLVFVLSGALDLCYHAVSAFWPGSLDAYLGPDGYYAHLALFFGMLFIVIGVILSKPKAARHQENSTSKQWIRR